MDKDRNKIFSHLFKAAVASRMEENKKRNMIDLQELLRITKFTKQEIKMMYRGFKQVREGYYVLPLYHIIAKKKDFYLLASRNLKKNPLRLKE